MQSLYSLVNNTVYTTNSSSSTIRDYSPDQLLLPKPREFLPEAPLLRPQFQVDTQLK